MKLEPIDFSRNVDVINLYQHLCYYHNEAFISLNDFSENPRLALDNFLRLYRLLRSEYNEYRKVKNSKYILSNSIFSQYVKNISSAYAKPTKVTSYQNLSSNLYDVQDYMKYGFNNIFCLTDEHNFVIEELDKYLGNCCVLELNNYEVYVGFVDIKLFSLPDENVESISILFFETWIQIDITKIKRINIL